MEEQEHGMNIEKGKTKILELIIPCHFILKKTSFLNYFKKKRKL